MRNNDIILNEQLYKINSLMFYDRSKSLNEQDPRWASNIGNAGWTNPATGTKVPGEMHIPDNYYYDVDIHDTLMAIEIGTALVAPLTGPYRPIFLGVSILAGLADAAVYYWVDDDPHSAWIAFGLAFVPEVKLLKYLKRSNWFIKKYGRKKAAEVLKKYHRYRNGNKGIKFTDDEIRFLRESGKDLAEEATQAALKQDVKATVRTGLLKIAAEKTVKGLLALIWNTAKFTGMSLKEIGKMGIVLGGTYVTFDQLYLKIWGDDADRQKSELKQIADLVENFTYETKEWLISIYDEQINGSGILGDGEEYKRYEDTVLAKNEPIQSADEYLAAQERVYQERQANLPGKKVTLDNIRLGKEDLHYGDQGPTVKQIQQMLIDLGLDVGDKGADGFFGDDTKDAVIDFQMYPDEYGLSDSIMLNKQEGIVGKETLLALEKALKLK